MALLVAFLGAACSTGPSSAKASDAIDRELFVQTYIDLRVAALETDGQELTDEARSEVLARHEVTAEDLVRFGEVHGGDLELMREIWDEVELRLDAILPEPSG